MLKLVLKSVLGIAMAAVALFLLVVVLGGLGRTQHEEDAIPPNVAASKEWKQSELDAAAAGREPANVTVPNNVTNKMPVVKIQGKAEEFVFVKGQIIDNDQLKVIRKMLPVDVDFTSPNTFSEQLSAVLAKHPKQLTIVIDSPGGNVQSGNQIISMIESTGLPVVTICDGMCASMGLTIFMSGDHRYLTNHSTVMAHPMSGGSNGDIYQTRSQSRYMERLAYRLDDYVASRAGLSMEQYLALARSEYYGDNEQAFAIGFSHGTAKLLVEHSYSIPVVENAPGLGNFLGLQNKGANVSPSQDQDAKTFLETLQRGIPQSVRTMRDVKW